MAGIFTGKRDVYIEIAQRYTRFIQLGLLKQGDKLPSVREAASELGVNPNTVQRAYVYLEEQGLIRSIPKKGAFVLGEEEIMPQGECKQTLVDALQALKAQGFTKGQLDCVMEEVFADD